MSELNDKAVYVFVRQDLSEGDQRIQLAHAVLDIAMRNQIEWADYRIIELDGGADRKAFQRTVRNMQGRGIEYIVYHDSDRKELGDTAIATMPLSKEESLPLANYRLRRNSPPVGSGAAVALDGQRGANAEVAQGQ
jgi:hypothetical protein